MEQNDDVVTLQFVKPIKLHKKHRKKSLNVDQLFRQIKYETEKQKEKKKIQQKSNDVYDRIAETLSKKLGFNNNRNKNLDDQLKVVNLIEMCKQHKHIRSKNHSIRPQTPPHKSRNSLSRPKTTKPISHKNQQLEPQTKKRIYSEVGQGKNPQTIQRKNTRTFSARSSNICQQTNAMKNDECENGIEKRNRSILKRGSRNMRKKEVKIECSKNHHGNKENNECVSIMNLDFDQNCRIDKENRVPFNKIGRKKCSKTNNRLNIQNTVKGIIASCDNTKQEVNKIGKKLGFFEYYSLRLNKNLQKVQEILPKANDFDDLYD